MIEMIKYVTNVEHLSNKWWSDGCPIHSRLKLKCLLKSF